MNICTFISSTGYLLYWSTFLQRETIICQFRTIYSVEAPQKVFLSIIFNIKRINAILYIDFIARNNLPKSVNGPSGLSAVAIPIPHVHSTSPSGHRIIHYVFITDFINIRCPYSPFRFEVWTGSICKSSTYIIPVYQVS